jgi:hypothetical protein
MSARPLANAIGRALPDCLHLRAVALVSQIEAAGPFRPIAQLFGMVHGTKPLVP